MHENAMRELPILFNTEMVLAILDGRKTQTRRVITSRNSYFNGLPWGKAERNAQQDWDNAWVDPGPSPAGNPGPYLKLPFPEDKTMHRIYSRIRPGDRLYVRETFFYEWPNEEPPDDMKDCRIVYRASEPDYITSDMREYLGEQYRWSPSSHMPKWAACIWLEVTDVRVERVQDISQEDAMAEGITSEEPLNNYGTGSIETDAFAKLWESIYVKRGYAWDANPWVWVIEFIVIEKNKEES